MSRCPKLYVALVVAALVAGVLAISGFEDGAQAIEQRQYCELVALHKANPDLGWPDFHGTFEQECNADGTVKEEAK